MRGARFGLFLGALVLLTSCGPPPLPIEFPRVENLDAPAPREIVFSHAYENRRGEPWAPLLRPTAVAVLPDGSFVLSDAGSGRLHVFDPEGFYRDPTDERGEEFLPLDVGVYGFLIYALDGGPRQILRFTEDGIFRDVLLDVGSLDPVGRVDPSAMAVDRDGRVAICDVAGHRVLLTGPFLNLDTVVGEYGSFPGQFKEPRGVAFGQSGLLYVSDRGNRRIQIFDLTGQPLASTRGVDDLDQPFLAPSGLATDRFGNVYVADTGSGSVWVLAPDLFPLMELGADRFAPGGLSRPVDVAVGPDDRLYVVDVGREALLVYDITFP